MNNQSCNASYLDIDDTNLKVNKQQRPQKNAMIPFFFFDKPEMNIQFGIALIRVIIIPLLFHSVAHTLPSIATHILMDIFKDLSMCFDHFFPVSFLVPTSLSTSVSLSLVDENHGKVLH